MIPHFLQHAIGLIEAETPAHQRILVLELRRELMRRWPVYHDVAAMDDYLRMAAGVLSRFPGATDSEIDEALAHEERNIHELRERLDFRDTAASVGPAVMVE